MCASLGFGLTGKVQTTISGITPMKSRLSRWLCGVIVAALFIATDGRAQDVTVTPLKWIDATDAPDELPSIKTTYHPKFPSELIKTSDVGYMLTSLIVDKNGKVLSFWYHATNPAYYRDSRDVMRWKLNPGRRGGQAVITATSLSVIFNPASAAENKPDATPRLLEAHWVVDSRKMKQDTNSREIVWATVSLDENGRPVKVSEAPGELLPLLETNVHRWRFAPARLAGKPVMADIRVPFIVLSVEPESKTDGSSKRPQIIRQTKPVYPAAMRESGIRGEVVVEFTVDIEGRVTNAFVARSLNAAFDEPALVAVRQWKFEPGLKEGVPVATRLQVPVLFQLHGAYEGGESGFAVKRKSDQAKLSPEFRYDKSAQIIASILPVYPYALLKTGAEDTVQVRLIVDPSGRVIYTDVTKARYPEMGEALLAALDYFEFTPALKDERPTQMMMAFEQKFDPDDKELVSWNDKELMQLEVDEPEKIFSMKNLDMPIKPLSQRPPKFPVKMMETMDKGEALIEVLIDTDGRVRLPRIVSASAPAFGYAAVQAVNTWLFEKPVRGGKPAVMRARIPFAFNLTSKPVSK